MEKTKKEEKTESKRPDQSRKTDEPKKLYRSRGDKIIAGVCGGIAEYFNIDPVWVRLAAVLLFFADGIGFLAYIIAWIIMPQNPYQEKSSETKPKNKVEKKESKSSSTMLIGLVIVAAGTVILMRNMFSWFDMKYVLPVAIIGLGAFMMVKANE